ncbi:Uncharacterised protein [Dorea longicatena]|nr:Uncharacterised protein [Dorea longicatena]
MSFVTILGADTPTKISAPSKASARVPFLFSKFVTSTIFSCIQFKFGESFPIIPLISHIVILGKPYVKRSFVIATPAEPAPFTTTRQFSFSLPVTFNAFIIPASTTIAVPC